MSRSAFTVSSNYANMTASVNYQGTKGEPAAGPTAIVQGPDHNVRFVETSIDRLGRVGLSGTRS
jgi:hypothetical protein